MTIECAVLAGGCFWGMQELIRKQQGILNTTVGYTGGETQNPKYNDIGTGHTGHTEAIKIEFDNQKTSFKNILNFFLPNT